ncbi:hypothetical protein N9L06_05985, partial [Mariniblastus sp.]|nr:hypothetical protein [Mariniblastus sp.]
TFPGSSAEFVGGEFRLNGSPFTDSSISLEFQGSDVFTGTFADGSPFVFSGLSGDRLNEVTLTQIALPTLDTTPIVVDAQNPIAPNGVRPGQILTLRDAGELRNNFAAVDATLAIEDGIVGSGLKVAQSAVDISGGSVGDGFDAFRSSTVNLDGGFVGDGFTAAVGTNVNIASGVVGEFFGISEGSTANVSGGEIGARASVSAGSTVNVSGGEIGERAEIYNSTINITGGSIGDQFAAEFGSEVNIRGGAVGDDFVAGDRSTVNLSGGSVGNRFFADHDSVLNIQGLEFFLDGAPLGLAMHSPLEITDRDVKLSGRLSDGTPFDFDLVSPPKRDGGDIFTFDATVTITVVPEPITGDFDVDGDVDGDDVDFFIGNLDQPATGNFTQLDLDGDGDVTIADHNFHVTTLVVTSNGVTGALLGDVNLDGVVDVLSDAFALVANLGQSATSRSQGDLNADGATTVLGDAFILISDLGQSNDP